MASQARDAQERKRHGRHYTPPELARFLARRALLHAPRADELRVLDPACGDGELLLAVHRELTATAPDLAVRLTGYDLDRHAVARTARRASDEGVTIDCRAEDFLAAASRLPDHAFDLIITNPPYVRTQQLGGATAQLLSKQFGLRGRIDLTHPFVAVAPRLLAAGGVLGLLCANRFLTTRAGANLRRILTTDLTPVELYDLGDTKLFTAAVLPAITVATRADHHPDCRYVSVYEEPGAEPDCATDLFGALAGESACLVGDGGRVFAVEVGVLCTGVAASAGTGPAGEQSAGVPSMDTSSPDPVSMTVPSASGKSERAGARPTSHLSVRASSPDRTVDTAWRMSRPGVDRWLARIAERTWRSFGETARIRVGIKTTADRVFISDRWEQMDPMPEPELLRQLITHRDLRPWQVAMARGTRVLYPYDVLQSRRTPIDLAEFPSAARYLRSHEQVLAGRRYVLDGGRKWFEIWVPQRPHLWGAPKLVFPDISERPRFALDRSGAVVNGDCYWISLTDLGTGKAATELAYLLMGVANSALGLRFYDAVCGNRLYSGRRRWITQYVARLPVPDPARPAAAEIVRRVRSVLEDGVPVADAGVDEVVAAAFGVQ
ncbi:Eco57I restriction-modification methylase domain-containing protein [Nocardia mangyaensis]|uniref:Eco57I restriction-modification methylase domain-containing protein n=1 Tax=Nocardia mangyaensis TaxID=2213200 RepID=UPI002674FEA9|nr:N-6 DNA methylase [Nocardia mangyaensis]MDO3648687.1 N-6 DNA methylase [Nocardia mangyaensis]